MEISGNIVVGNPDVEPSAASHTSGVREGNWRKSMIHELAEKRHFLARATPRRSTGINPRAEQPIDPRMPVLTPA
jgi:hypothetical protein